MTYEDAIANACTAGIDAPPEVQRYAAHVVREMVTRKAIIAAADELERLATGEAPRRRMLTLVARGLRVNCVIAVHPSRPALEALERGGVADDDTLGANEPPDAFLGLDFYVVPPAGGEAAPSFRVIVCWLPIGDQVPLGLRPLVFHTPVG